MAEKKHGGEWRNKQEDDMAVLWQEAGNSTLKERMLVNGLPLQPLEKSGHHDQTLSKLFITTTMRTRNVCVCEWGVSNHKFI